MSIVKDHIRRPSTALPESSYADNLLKNIPRVTSNFEEEQAVVD